MVSENDKALKLRTRSHTMQRFVLAIIMLAAFSIPNAAVADDWDDQEYVIDYDLRVQLGLEEEDEDSEGDEDSEEEQAAERADGMNFGMFFGRGDEFVNSNVDWDAEIFIVDEVVDARFGRALGVDENLRHGSTLDGSFLMLGDRVSSEPEDSEEYEEFLSNRNADAPDNVIGPAFGVPEDALGMEDYNASNYPGIEALMEERETDESAEEADGEGEEEEEDEPAEDPEESTEE